jgi:hypothetical protein
MKLNCHSEQKQTAQPNRIKVLLDCHPERSEMKSEAIHFAQSRDLVFVLGSEMMHSQAANIQRPTTNDQRPNHVR